MIWVPISFTKAPWPILIRFLVTAPLCVNSAQRQNAQRQYDEQLHCRNVWQKKKPILTFVIDYLFILFYLPHNDYKKYKPKKSRKKKEVARRPFRNCRSLSEVRPPRSTGYGCLTWIEEKMAKIRRWKIYELFWYLLNNLIFSIFLKEERD